MKKIFSLYLLLVMLTCCTQKKVKDVETFDIGRTFLEVTMEMDTSKCNILNNSIKNLDSSVYIIIKDSLYNNTSTAYSEVIYSNSANVYRDLGALDLCIRNKDTFLIYNKGYSINSFDSILKEYFSNKLNNGYEDVELTLQLFLNITNEDEMSAEEWMLTGKLIKQYYSFLQKKRKELTANVPNSSLRYLVIIGFEYDCKYYPITMPSSINEIESLIISDN